MARAIGRISTSYQTPKVKGRSRFFGLGKMLGKVGKRMLGPVSYGGRGVSSYLNSPAASRRSYLNSPAASRRSYLNSPAASRRSYMISPAAKRQCYLKSPAARRRRSGHNYMAELAEYKEVREVRWVKEGEESIDRGQARRLVTRTPEWKRRRGIKVCLGNVLARGKRFFVTPAKPKQRFFKDFTPDKLTGGWRGDLAKWSRKRDVILLDTNVLLDHLGVVEDLLSCNGPMIYIAAIVYTELDGLKKSPKPELEQKARRASHWVQRALRKRKIVTQSALEEEEAKNRWPQEISGTRKGDVILLATAKWLVDVRGVQVDKAVVVTNDRIEEVGALTEQIRVCNVDYLKSRIYSE